MTFKQYINESEGMHENDRFEVDPTSLQFQMDTLADLKTVITAPPYNYTWTDNTTTLIKRVAILAHRTIEDKDAFGITDTERVFQTYVTRDSDDILCINVEYPQLHWNQPSGFTDADPLDFKKYPLFQLKGYQVYQPDNLVPLNADDAKFQSFEVYNYYLAQPGTMPEKVINTLEYIKDYWKRSGWWDGRDDALLLKAKIRYLPRERIAKRDFIKGALMDAL